MSTWRAGARGLVLLPVVGAADPLAAAAGIRRPGGAGLRAGASRVRGHHAGRRVTQVPGRRSWRWASPSPRRSTWRRATGWSATLGALIATAALTLLDPGRDSGGRRAAGRGDLHRPLRWRPGGAPGALAAGRRPWTGLGPAGHRSDLRERHRRLLRRAAASAATSSTPRSRPPRRSRGRWAAWWRRC